MPTAIVSGFEWVDARIEDGRGARSINDGFWEKFGGFEK